MALDPIALAGIGLICMFVLILLHVPLGVAMGVAGVAGFAMLSGWKPALSLMASETASAFSNLDLATIPLFILMGGFASAAGLSEDLYRIAYALVGHRRGGLAAATIAGCAGFGAVCGSSIATTATFGKVALPSMLQRNYAPGFATGTIAAGGTLGILVPPSVIMVIYAVLAQELIIKLYIAAIVPSLIAISLHFSAIAIYVRLNPMAAPAGERMGWAERWRVMRGGWAVIALIGIVLAGMSFGVFTATEAAAVGALLAFVFALARGKLTGIVMRSTLMETASTTGMIYVIIVGAALFGYFIEVSQAPRAIVAAIGDSGLAAPVILALMMAVYLVLGAIFDEVAVLVITLPFVLPLIKSWGYDPVWWGIINVVIVELGMLIPPLGMNVFVIYSIAGKVPLTDIYRGVTPYIVSNVVRLACLLAFPMLTLWLPKLLKG
jgi:tripartite ATP-independent transporter DctM subunit